MLARLGANAGPAAGTASACVLALVVLLSFAAPIGARTNPGPAAAASAARAVADAALSPLRALEIAGATNGTAPLTIVFESEVTGGVPPYTYAWAFGDGATSTLANVTHTYAAPGQYVVYLNVSDALNDHASANELTVTVFGPPQAPTPLSPVVLLASILILVAVVLAVRVMWRRRQRTPPSPPEETDE